MSEKILNGRDFTPVLNKIGLGEFLFNSAEKYRDNICQIDADLNISETYGSVKTRSIRLALNLQKKGITSKDVICFCSYNSLDNGVAIISSLYLGAKISNLDPSLSPRNMKHLITLVKPKLFFIEEESLQVIENIIKEVQLDCEIIVFGKSNKYETFSNLVLPCDNEDKFRPPEVDIHDIAVMLFSSGSTGLPKAICHNHFSFLQIMEIANDLSFSNERSLHFTTMYWISGVIMLLLPFMNGGTRVFARSFEGESTFKMIEKYQLTSLFLAPIYTYKLTSVPHPEKYDFSSLRFFLTGGTTMSTDQYKKLSRLFSNAQIIFGYGMSESGMVSSFHWQYHKDFLKTKIGSCGKVAPRSSIKIVNPNTEEVLGPNQKGEVRMKSDGLMMGYYHADSSSCFDQDGYLKSGDIGYYDEDECLYVIERIKEMFKYLSWHIVPSSIEAVLLEHPAVKETVVFGIPRGEEGEVPAACVVLKEGYDVDKEEIEKFVGERVSDKEKLRGGVIFTKNLPRTPSGKLIRNEIRNIVIKSM